MVYKLMGAVRARVLQNPYPPATPITATVGLSLGQGLHTVPHAQYFAYVYTPKI